VTDGGSQPKGRAPLVAALAVVLLGIALVLVGAVTSHHAYRWVGVVVLIVGVVGIRVASIPHLGRKNKR
jgi:hypothetical protein